METERLDKLCYQLVQITDRNYLLNQYCNELKTDHSDIFAKARAYTQAYDQVNDAGVLQYGVPIESPPGPRVVMEFFGQKQKMIMLASNDYLNLSTDPRVHEAIRRCLDEYGVGAGSSRVGTGYSYMHKELEEKLADSFGKEAAILFPTGFDAIAQPAVSLLTPNDRVILDGSAHAALLEGAHMSGATVRVFSHNSVERLEDQLKRARKKVDETGGGLLVMVEGAYSMDGDVPDLPKMLEVCRKYGARILVDEAHGIGVLGAKGRGACEHHGVSKEIDLIGGTFSKSLGATGGFVAADRDVIRYLNYLSRKLMFSAALPPILIAGVKAALDVMESDTSMMERLRANVAYLARGLRQIGANVLGTDTGCVPILFGRDGIIFKFTQDLIRNGIFTFPAVYPTVPKDKSTFRLSVQAGHSQEDLNKTIEVFDKLFRKYNVVQNH